MTNFERKIIDYVVENLEYYMDTSITYNNESEICDEIIDILYSSDILGNISGYNYLWLNDDIVDNWCVIVDLIEEGAIDIECFKNIDTIAVIMSLQVAIDNIDVIVKRSIDKYSIEVEEA